MARKNTAPARSAISPIILRVKRLALFLGACGGSATALDAAVPTAHATSHRSLIGNDMAEAHLIGGPADEAGIHLTVTGDSLTWNIHAHLGTETLTAERGDGSADVDFVPSEEATWNLILRNTSAVDSVEVDAVTDLYGAMTWQDFD